jgi:hypothetical protein
MLSGVNRTETLVHLSANPADAIVCAATEGTVAVRSKPWNEFP